MRNTPGHNIDLRGRYYSGVVDKDTLEGDLEGAVFYRCFIPLSPSGLRDFVRYELPDSALAIECVAMQDNEIDLKALPPNIEGAEFVKCTVRGISRSDLGDSVSFYSCNFNRASFKRLDDLRSPQSLTLIHGMRNTFDRCIFDTPGYTLNIESPNSSFADCGFDEFVFQNTHPTTTSLDRAWGYTVPNFLSVCEFERCTFKRLRCLNLVGKAEDLGVYNKWFNEDLQDEYYQLDRAPKTSGSDSKYDRMGEIREEMESDLKSRVRNCEFNILFPLFKEGTPRLYGPDETLEVPWEPFTLYHAYLASDTSRLTTDLTDEDIYRCSALSYMRSRARTLEDFLCDIKTEGFEWDTFERYTGYPRAILDIASKLTFTFWHKRVAYLDIQGDDPAPVQNFEVAASVGQIVHCKFANLQLSMVHDLPYYIESNYTWVANTSFKNCRLHIENLIFRSRIVFENCTFDPRTKLAMRYDAHRNDAHVLVEFVRCDLRGLTLFGASEGPIMNVVGAGLLIQEGRIVFKDCEIDDTTLIEYENYRGDGPRVQTKSLLDILKRAQTP
jgi:hypothetical protein